MNIHLTGFFDRNFGDDLMQLMVTDAMPQHDFFVFHPQEEMLAHLSGKKNVHINQSGISPDAYVNVIGTGFIYNGKRAILEKLLSVAKEKRLKLTKTAIVDCSTVPAAHKISELLAARELRKYNYISCRDPISEGVISRANKKAKIAMHNDIVFSLDDSLIFPKTEEDCLGIIPVQRNYSHDNFAYYKIIAAACDNYIEKTGKKILLFAFDTGMENDTAAVLSITRLMKHADMSERILYNSDIGYIMQNIARCDKVISSRFHGIIAAMLTGACVGSICDTPKIRQLSEKYGFGLIEKNELRKDALISLIDSCTTPAVVPLADKKDAGLHIQGLAEYLGE